jgi:hypothetical protein
MKRKLVAILLMSLAPTSVAQKKVQRPPSRPTAHATQASTGPGFLSTAFDINQSQLPSGFKGHDVRQLCKAFEVRENEQGKNEFETTAQHAERVAQINARPIMGQLPITATFSFVLSETNDVYDADKQLMHVSIPTSTIDMMSFSTKNPIGFMTNTEITLDRYYDATNAMGAHVTVHKIYSRRYGIRQTNLRDFAYLEKESTFLSQAFAIDLPLSPDDARAAKGNIRALLAGKLEPPYLTKGAFLQQPKFDSPSDIFEQQCYLNFQVAELWLFNVRTGKVYEKRVALPAGDILQ